MGKSVTVAIDARLPDIGQGGVQQVINTLAAGFTSINDSDVKRLWVVLKGTRWWLKTLPIGDQIVQVAPPYGGISLRIANRFPRLVSLLFPLLSRLFRAGYPYDELLHDYDVDLVHLPFQDGFNTRLPTIYHPHDLQHHYLRTNFNRAQVHHRETVWRTKAELAEIVMAASPYVVSDLIKYWNISPSRIRMVPIPPPERTETEDEVLARIPTTYILYPAAFWNHKNHKNLILAIETLKHRGLEVSLVLVGAPVGEFVAMKKLVHECGVDNSIRFLGHVTNAELTSLIRNALFVVVPSLFEAMSLTVWDAQRLGTAVACSDVPPFPCQVGESARLFDPADRDSIADAISDLWTNESLRVHYSEAGLRKVSRLSSSHYAKAMVGIYLETLGLSVPSENLSAFKDLAETVCSSDEG